MNFEITDKKTDTVSTYTEPEVENLSPTGTSEKTLQIDDTPPDAEELANKLAGKEEVDEDLDESEMSKIKEFLEETVSMRQYSLRLKYLIVVIISDGIDFRIC